MEYKPHLDGLRALAVLAVVAFHARVPGFPGGYVGVDLFFVLSGYLITQVLASNPDLPRFYIRRAKRLIPPLALLLIAYLLIFPVVRPGQPHVRDSLIAFFYLSDYFVAFWNKPEYLRHTWSLAVEEHFYLLWPLVMLKLRPSIKALLIAYIAATAWRWGWDGWHEAYSRFDTRLSGLLLGCILAGLTIKRTFPAWPGLVVLAVATFAYRWEMPWVQGAGFMIVELAAAIAIIGTPPAWLSTQPLVYLGKLSYGIYLWHYPITKLCRESGADWLVVLLTSLALSILLAAASYHLVEIHFRHRRETGSGSAAIT